jgi:SAM-dependent methyltransferase
MRRYIGNVPIVRNRKKAVYYSNKLKTLRDIFGAEDIHLTERDLTIDGRTYPVVDDVIILLAPSCYPKALKQRMQITGTDTEALSAPFAEDIQFTFGEEWQRFPDILKEHQQIFQQYFDLVDMNRLTGQRVCDLGCGIGRWSYFLADRCRELVLVDFSEAIFVARRNLAHKDNVLFFMGDLKGLPFREDVADFLFCLGVLHHLPSPALDEVRSLKTYAPCLLIYLYYALDNRPWYFRSLLALVTGVRSVTTSVKNRTIRDVFTWSVAVGIYLPLLFLGTALKPVGMAQAIPLYEAYHSMSLKQIRQDVYDRFFTRIEQRVRKDEIVALEDTFSRVTISDQWPYWHFTCER